jgi:hypothetical protein
MEAAVGTCAARSSEPPDEPPPGSDERATDPADGDDESGVRLPVPGPGAAVAVSPEAPSARWEVVVRSPPPVVQPDSSTAAAATMAVTMISR